MKSFIVPETIFKGHSRSSAMSSFVSHRLRFLSQMEKQATLIFRQN